MIRRALAWSGVALYAAILLANVIFLLAQA